jgi:hypothetical protein
MIVFDLKCNRGHVFEAWFNDAATYEKLRKARHISCSMCDSTKVEKALMAPRVATRKGRGTRKTEDRAAETRAKAAEKSVKTPAQPTAIAERYATDPQAVKAAELMKQLTELRQQVEKNCDYVGENFPEEARKIHYGETEKRNIYGEASPEEASEMADEGIEFAQIPWLPRRDA